MAIWSKKTMTAVLALLELAHLSKGETDCSNPSVQSYDGTCNNVAQPVWGELGLPYTGGTEGQKFGPGGSFWIEQTGVMSAEELNEREISNDFMAVEGGRSINSKSRLSHNTLWMGQFVTHDFSKIHRNRFEHPYYTDTLPWLVLGENGMTGGKFNGAFTEWSGVHPTDPSKCLPKFGPNGPIPCQERVNQRMGLVARAQNRIDANGIPGIAVLKPTERENEIARIMYSRNPLLAFTGEVSNPVIVHPDLMYELNGDQRVIQNEINAWLDLSQVYGDTSALNYQLRTTYNGIDETVNGTGADLPRTFVGGGKLATYDYVGRDGAKTVQYRPSGMEMTDLYDFLPTAEKISAHVRPNDPTRAFVPENEFLAGDDRVSENMQLMTIHLAFHRYHNIIAEQMAIEHADEIANMSAEEADEWLFQKARRFTIAVYQHILYDEYLYALLGKDMWREYLGEYKGYDPNIDPQTNINFANSAFRYAHSSVPQDFQIKNQQDENILQAHTAEIIVPMTEVDPNTGSPKCDAAAPENRDEAKQVCYLQGNIDVVGRSFIPEFGTQNTPNMHQGAPNPPFTMVNHVALMKEGGIANVMRSMSRTVTSNIDLIYEDNIRDVVAAQSMINAGIDLAAIDIRSARESGVPDYDTLRKTYLGTSVYEQDGWFDGCRERHRDEEGEDPLACFLEVTSDFGLAYKLRKRYKKVKYLEGYVGLLAEDKERRSSPLPRTMAKMIADEFDRKRRADRFWYENVFKDDPEMLERIWSVSMADIFEQTACGKGESMFNANGEPTECKLEKSEFGRLDSDDSINIFQVDRRIDQIEYERGACMHLSFYPYLNEKPEGAFLPGQLVLQCSEQYTRDACEASDVNLLEMAAANGVEMPDLGPLNYILNESLTVRAQFLKRGKQYGEQLCPDEVWPHHVGFFPIQPQKAAGTCRQGFIHTRDRIYEFDLVVDLIPGWKSLMGLLGLETWPFDLNVEEAKKWCTSDEKTYSYVDPLTGAPTGKKFNGGLFGEWTDGQEASPSASQWPAPTQADLNAAAEGRRKLISVFEVDEVNEPKKL